MKIPEPFVKERIAEWAYWIHAREQIRKNREKRLPAPWTKDPVMRQTRWCNVRRMDDKVSVWMMKNWYRGVKTTKDPHDAILAALLARMINRTDTLAYCTGGMQFKKFEYGHFYERLYEVKNSGRQVFTNAYIINGASGGPKIDQVLNAIRLADDHMRRDGAGRFYYPKSMQKTAESLHVLPGVGSFIAGQVVADLRWVLPGTSTHWLDRMSWAPVGPGSSRGMRYLIGDISASEIGGRGNDLSNKTFLPLLQRLMGVARDHSIVAPIFHERGLEAHDIQNTLCETSKYIRVKYNVGRAKNQYDDSPFLV